MIEKRKFFTCLRPNELVVWLGYHMILWQTEEALCSENIMIFPRGNFQVARIFNQVREGEWLSVCQSRAPLHTQVGSEEEKAPSLFQCHIYAGGYMAALQPMSS